MRFLSEIRERKTLAAIKRGGLYLVTRNYVKVFLNVRSLSKRADVENE